MTNHAENTMRQTVSLESWIRILSILGAVIAFAWGVYQFATNQRNQSETRRIEATKPFLDRQLKLYTDATQVASAIATSTDPAEKSSAIKRFWQLYWGELALVEDRRVEAAMMALGAAIKRDAPVTDIERGSLNLAHACRESLADSWGVQQWRDPNARPDR